MILGIAIGFGNAKASWMRYVKACEHIEAEYELVDIVCKDWLENVLKVQKKIAGLLVGPPCEVVEQYDIYMERLYFIVYELNILIYPGYASLMLYENKRYCTSWLEYHGYQTPKTWVLANKKEAFSCLNKTKYPVVIKAGIGAGSSAVHIVKSKFRAKMIARQVFGLNRFITFGFVSWGRYQKAKIPFWFPMIGSALKHYMIVQEYLPIKWEWRIIKIGESYFGHQKLLKGLYASGSLNVGWNKPPLQLLDLVRDVCSRGGFESVAMDVFETTNGELYINELQSMFGSLNDSQMYIDGKPGRYLYKNEKYFFEEGYFNKFGSCLLRVEHFLDILKK
jgi:hypothetical protein